MRPAMDTSIGTRMISHVSFGQAEPNGDAERLVERFSVDTRIAWMALALAGHVKVGDWAILSGYTLVHQFCQIGAHAFSGMGSAIGKDVPAFVTVSGAPAQAKTINLEGLRRRGFSSDAIGRLRRAFKVMYRQGLTLDLALQRLDSMFEKTPEVLVLIDSIRASERGIVR